MCVCSYLKSGLYTSHYQVLSIILKYYSSMYRHSLRLLLLIIWLCYDAIYCYVVYAYFTSLPASNQFLVYCRVLFSYVYTISLASRLVLDSCALLCWGRRLIFLIGFPAKAYKLFQFESNSDGMFGNDIVCVCH